MSSPPQRGADVWHRAMTSARAARANPLNFDAVNEVMQILARLAADANLDPRTERPALQNLPASADWPLISVVICSIDERKFRTVADNYRALIPAAKLDLIGIHDAKGLNEAYNRGLDASRGEIVIFSHDDIQILNEDFAARVARHLQAQDVIGVAGTTRVTGPGVMWSGHPYSHGWVTHPDKQRGGWMVSSYTAGFETVENAQALDGVWMAARRDAARQIRFDANLPGFHFYDLDFSYRAYLAALRVAICPDLRIVHESFGNFGPAWQQAQQRFVAKYPRLNAKAGSFHSYGAHVQSLDAVQRFYAWLERLSAETLATSPP